MIRQKLLRPLLFAVVSMLVSSCGPGQFLGPTITPSPTFTLTPTITPSPTPTATLTSTSTATLTPLPTNTATPAPTETSRIEGNFSRSDTNKPIADVTISLFLPDSEETIDARTDTQGNFTFSEVKPDTYDLGFLLVFNNQSEFPCGNFNLDVSVTRGNVNILSPGGPFPWISATGTKNGDALLLMMAGNNQEFTIEADDVIRMQLKLRCN